MKGLTVNSYIGFILNPFRTYNLDFEGVGILEIEKGIFTSSGRVYDLFPISNALYKVTLTQKLFSLGDVSFMLKKTIKQEKLFSVISVMQSTLQGCFGIIIKKF